MSIRIDDDSSATLVGQYISPHRELDSSQGSHQVLPNGNHFLGLGSEPSMYEQTEGGTPVFYAKFGDFPIQSYRSYKFEWTSNPPESEIGLFSYSRDCYGNVVHYASWNGATKVASWDFYTGSSEFGEFIKTASQPYNGSFETVASTPFDLYAYAVAYDNEGHRLGQSPTVQTWTPDPTFGEVCTDMACPPRTDYTGSPRTECPIPVTMPTYDDLEFATNLPVAARDAGDEPSLLYKPIARRPRKTIA